MYCYQRFLPALKYLLHSCDPLGISHSTLKHSRLQLLPLNISNEHRADAGFPVAAIHLHDDEKENL